MTGEDGMWGEHNEGTRAMMERDSGSDGRVIVRGEGNWGRGEENVMSLD